MLYLPKNKGTLVKSNYAQNIPEAPEGILYQRKHVKSDKEIPCNCEIEFAQPTLITHAFRISKVDRLCYRFFIQERVLFSEFH